MDFTNRGVAQTAAAARSNNGGNGSVPSQNKHNRWKNNPLWLRVVWIVLLFSGAILVASLCLLMYLGGSNEARMIDKSKYQAVFLNNGQVYFGKVKDINSNHLDLRDIFYLNVNQQVQPSDNQPAQANISLVKLGCELHGPADQMIVNREQVTFWENLREEGQVTKAIDEWIKQNPNGQTCQAPNNNNNGNSENGNNEEQQ